MKIEPISRKSPVGMDPLYVLNYSEVRFKSPQYQSIRTKLNESPHVNNESVTNCSLKENSMQSIELSNLDVPEFESTAISMNKQFKSNHWAKLELVSDFFIATEITSDSYTFGILDKDCQTNANSSIDLDFIPASIYKCISRKQFNIQRNHLNSSDGVVAVLQDKSKNGTFVNDKLLGIDVKIGLKNGDIIGLAYFTKDMTMKNCNAFKFFVQESKISPNKSFPTLIESSENNQQNIQAKNKTVEFVSDQSIEFISDIIKPKNAKRKRKY